MERVGRTRKRNSPSRYEPEMRSKSKSRKEKDVKKNTKVKKSQSPARKSQSPARRSSRSRKPVNKKERTSSPSPSLSASPSPAPTRALRSVTKIKKKLIDIRDSITPDRKMVEDVVRSSVQKFDEIASEVVKSVKNMSRSSFKDQFDKNKKNRSIDEESDSETASFPQNNRSFKASSFTGLKKNITALFIIFFYPTISILSQVACEPGNCALVPNVTNFKYEKLVDKDAAIWFTSYFLLQLILASLPIGFKSDGILSRGSRLSYRNNGLSAFVVTTFILYAIQRYYAFPLVKLLDKTLPFLVTSIGISLVLSVFLFIKSVYSKVIRNASGNTGYVLSDFCEGREINPRLGPLDFKTAIFRTSFITYIVYDLLVILKEIEGKPLNQASIPLLVLSVLQLLYCLDFLIFESSFLTSYTVSQDGFGYAIITAMMICPFWLALLTKYLSIAKGKYNLYAIVPAVILHVIGHAIYRLSTYQKDRFIRNPRGEKITDVIQERRSGTNLYRGGLWKYVRHPNYLGNIIIQISWSVLLLGVAPIHWIPILLPIVTLIEHIVHVNKVEGKSHIRHPTSWPTYTLTTKYALIPRIF